MTAHVIIAVAIFGGAAAQNCPPHVYQTVTVEPNSKADVTLFSDLCEVGPLIAQVPVETGGGGVSMVDLYNYPTRAQKSSSITTPHFVTAANSPPECKGGSSSIFDEQTADTENYFAKLNNGNIVGVLKRECPGNAGWVPKGTTASVYQNMVVLLNAQGEVIDQNPIADKSSIVPRRVALSAMKDDHFAIAMITSTDGASANEGNLTVQAFVAPGTNGWPGDGIVGQASGLNKTQVNGVEVHSAIDVATVGTGEVVVTYCRNKVRYFKKIFPIEEDLFQRQDDVQCGGQDSVTMKGVQGSSRLWVMSGVSGKQVPSLKPAGFESSQVLTASLYDVASKEFVSNLTLGHSYAQKDCMAIVTSPNGKTLFAFEEGGPDNMAFAIVDADGQLLVEDRNVLEYELEACQAVAYDDNTFGIFMIEDESEHCWSVHVDDTGFKRSTLIQCDDRYAASSRTFAMFPDGYKQTLIQKAYTGNGNRQNIVALNGYRGYLDVSRKKASPGVATVFNYSPKNQTVSLFAATRAMTPSPGDPCATAPMRLYSTNMESPAAAGAMQTWIYPLFSMLGCISFILCVAFIVAGWRPWNMNPRATRTLSRHGSSGEEGSEEMLLVA